MRGLNRLYYIKIEIANIKQEINDLPEISAINMSGMPHSTGVSDTVYQLYLKKEKLTQRLIKKVEQYYDELVRVEDTIDSIEDAEVRVIARMRFIQHKKWSDIGKEVHLDRSVCSRKLKAYFDNHQI